MLSEVLVIPFRLEANPEVKRIPFSIPIPAATPPEKYPDAALYRYN